MPGADDAAADDQNVQRLCPATPAAPPGAARPGRVPAEGRARHSVRAALRAAGPPKLRSVFAHSTARTE